MSQVNQQEPEDKDNLLKLITDFNKMNRNHEVNLEDFKEFKFLSYEYFTTENKFKRNQDIQDSLFTRNPRRIIFLSHKWETNNDPDPTGIQFRTMTMMTHMDKEAGYFYDYSSIPQNPRTSDEDILFKSCLGKLNDLIKSSLFFVIIRSDVLLSAWCSIEIVLAIYHKRLIQRALIPVLLNTRCHRVLKDKFYMTLTQISDPASLFTRLFNLIEKCSVTNGSDRSLLLRICSKTLNHKGDVTSMCQALDGLGPGFTWFISGSAVDLGEKTSYHDLQLHTASMDKDFKQRKIFKTYSDFIIHDQIYEQDGVYNQNKILKFINFGWAVDDRYEMGKLKILR